MTPTSHEARALALDTPLDQPDEIFARSSAGEVLPQVISPLAWELIGHAFDEANRSALGGSIGAFTRREQRSTVFVAKVEGWLYVNISALRATAERVPWGNSWQAVDAYGGLSAGVPPYRETLRDKLYWLRTAPSSLLAAAALPMRRGRDHRRLVAALARWRAATSPPAVYEELLAWRELVVRLLTTHHVARIFAAGSLMSLGASLRMLRVDPNRALELTASLPGLASAESTHELERLARHIAGDDHAVAALDSATTLGGLVEAIEQRNPELARRLASFADRFSHRGVAEFDPTVSTWGHDSGPILVYLRLLAHSAAGRPDGRRPTRTRRRNPILATMAWPTRFLIKLSEQTKSDTLEAIHVMRELIATAARTWEPELGVGAISLMTLEELAALADGRRPDLEELERRRAELAAAAARPAPEVIVVGAGASPVAVAATDAPALLTGVGASPGIAVGRARVVTEPTFDLMPDDILVAVATDTAWTPMFLVVAGVVTDSGSLMSHAAIVARDLGVPTVVGTSSATATIPDGATIEVDGSAGTVRVLSDAPDEPRRFSR